MSSTDERVLQKTFHLIDRGNGKEAKYDMARESKSHKWVPKLVFRMFNMVLNNTYVIYKELVSRDGGNPFRESNERACLTMGKAVRELVHGLCQWGEPIQTRVVTHPVHWRDMD